VRYVLVELLLDFGLLVALVVDSQELGQHVLEDGLVQLVLVVEVHEFPFGNTRTLVQVVETQTQFVVHLLEAVDDGLLVLHNS